MGKKQRNSFKIDLKKIIKKMISVFMILFFVTYANASYINNPSFSISWDFEIENDITKTSSTNVILDMNLVGVSEMRFWNTSIERDSASWEAYSSSKTWNLTPWEWKKTVYASFKNTSGDVIHTYDDIIYKLNPSLPYSTWLTLWLDAEDSGTITESSGNISAWNDKSWNNYHALQDTVSEQANLLTNEIDFNGTSEYFYIDNLHYTNSNPLDWLLVCWVFRTNHTSTSYNDNWAILDFDRSEWFNFYNKWGDYWFSYDSDGTVRDITTSWAGINDNTWHVACASYDNSITNDTVISINWNTEYTWNIEPNWAQIWVSQATRYWFVWDWSEAWTEDASRNNRYYDGSIWEIIYFDSAVWASDRKDIECYLWEKWNINVAWCTSDTIAPIGSIEYSPETTTTWYVTAKLINESESITITNNGWSDTYVFSDNWSFTFNFEDSNWNTGSTSATVNWIDTNWLPLIWSWTENSPPEITSYSWSTSIDISVLSWATDITTISAIDNAYNVVWEFGKTTLSWNSWTDIWHYEMCSPAVTISHRWNVNWEIQRAPRVRNKTWTWFQVKVDNYNSSIWTLNTNIDYVVFNSGNHDFSWLQIQAGSSSVSTVACNTSNNPWTATNVMFSPSFSSPPSVLHTISTENDSTWVVSWVNGNDGTRQSEPTTSSMGMILQRSFNSCTHSSEDVDYIAFEPWHYNTIMWFEVDAVRSTDSISSVSTTWNPINFFSSFASAPWVALVSQLWEDGWNGWYGQIHIGWWVQSSLLYATVDEDGPWADRNHTTEVFSSVAFSSDSWQFVEDNIISYFVSWWNDTTDFSIDPVTWELSFVSWKDPSNPTDSNWDGIYEVTVSACDSHCNTQCSYQSFNVSIGDNTAPTIEINYSSGSILAGWNHTFEIDYLDNLGWSWIDTTSFTWEYMLSDNNVATFATITHTPSTTWWVPPHPQSIVNGVKRTDWSYDYEFHSDSPNAFIEFDLDTGSHIWAIKIFNRSAWLEERLSNATIDFYDESDSIIYTHTLGDTTWMDIIDIDLIWIDEVHYAKKIRLESHGTDSYINIREIEIFQALKKEVELYKYNAWLWWADISDTFLNQTTRTATKTTYYSNNLNYWKYKIVYRIYDQIWNLAEEEIVFYIDKPELIVSTWSVDIWTINNTNNNFAPDIVVTVKTIWAPFQVILQRNQALSDIEIIPYHNGTNGFWYDKNNDGNLNNFDDDIIGQEALNINTDWNLNTYTYYVKMWAITSLEQVAWNYEAQIDFWLELGY